MTATVKNICPSCDGGTLESFYSAKNIPVHSCQLFQGPAEARSIPTGELTLAFCNHCGFISNTQYDESLQSYSAGYEDQQCFSDTFNAFARELAGRLIEKYSLRGKSVIEVGCGKGDFLALLCEIGDNIGVGIDPACDEDRLSEKQRKQITLVKDVFREEHSKYPCDFFCCRHSLEHIGRTAEFLKTIRRTIGDRLDTIIFFDLPEARRVLKELAFWDIYYEHCSYFTAGSLARLFRYSGFEIVDISIEYDDQYLLLEAKPSSQPSSLVHPSEETVEALAKEVEGFRSQVPRQIMVWKERIQKRTTEGRRVALWGSGSKCVSFLSAIELENEIGTIVDINPHRHGMFLPSSGREIVSPKSLKEYKPDTVVIMNPVYRHEIAQMLREMGLSPELLTL